MGVADGGELAMHAQGAMGVLQELIDELEGGAVESGTRRFIEEVALGPGAWDLIPPDDRAALVQNAPAFVAEQRDPTALDLDIAAVRHVDVPLLLTKGEGSPPLLRMLLDRLAGLLPAARTLEIPGAGHVPHETHPDAYVEVIADFLTREEPLAA
jgi:pimeloyl-ACP methyl ester carboxylesterase